MTELIQCPSCDGLRMSRQRRCPHCDAEPVNAARRGPGVVMALSLGAAIVAPLSACYGHPIICQEPDGGFCQLNDDMDASTIGLDGGSDAGLPDGGDVDAGTPDGGPADA